MWKHVFGFSKHHQNSEMGIKHQANPVYDLQEEMRGKKLKLIWKFNNFHTVGYN